MNEKLFRHFFRQCYRIRRINEKLDDLWFTDPPMARRLRAHEAHMAAFYYAGVSKAFDDPESEAVFWRAHRASYRCFVVRDEKDAIQRVQDRIHVERFADDGIPF